ncbi:bacteriophage antitermination protein Q [Klebsiella pneumoniae]|uniref:bacteriophage antitermination protein Q n=1 Tax=Klebsiella pneumoniae TaxID=573 RepID=UPI001F4A3F82|nr:bacteriophage antitermination protein Q [Klebsiella pneumoniae]HBW3346603.1 antitermination protein [Klebsiella pneumoniae]
MSIQILADIREELFWALADFSGKTKGQLEAFRENPLAEKGGYKRQPVHTIEFEDGRRVKSEIGAVYVMETRSRRRPMPPIGDREFEGARWRRAVNRLEPYEQAWLRYCYGFDLKFSYQEIICKYVWEIHKKNNLKKMQRRVEKKLIALVWLAAQEIAARNMNDTYKEKAGAVLASLMSIHRQTWGETYAGHWQQFKNEFSELDRQSLLRARAMSN